MKESNGFGLEKRQARTLLHGRFQIPPFTVLRMTDADWMRRKREWLALGIKSETGRNSKVYNGHEWIMQKKSRELAKGDGISIFDPVLTEICYRWYCIPGGQIIDPFAGGSVRGIVATVLGYRYWGSELRPEQVSANQVQAKEIIPEDSPVWICGDAYKMLSNAPKADFIFSCPPYGDLEVYSKLPRDLSNMGYQDFRDAYAAIIRRAVDKLKDNRFACFVVGNFRDKKTGFYHDFVGDTVRCFRKAGMGYYNDAVLYMPLGSLYMRVSKQFQGSRKMGKCHQNILVFYKGDTSKIQGDFGDVQQ